MLAGGATLVTAYVVFPVIKFFVPPIAPVDAQSKVQAATLDELKPNSAKFFRFLDRPAVLVKLPDGTYKALSAKCTHLGWLSLFENIPRSRLATVVAINVGPLRETAARDSQGPFSKMPHSYSKVSAESVGSTIQSPRH